VKRKARSQEERRNERKAHEEDLVVTSSDSHGPDTSGQEHREEWN